MLSAIEIHNYQSLHHVELTLKPLTVIVGPSSCGKSAFTRALKMLTSNQRGTSFITHGERQTTVKATTEKGVVVLKRGDENSYVVIPSDPEEQQRTFTKLTGQVPEEVTTFLGIPAKDPLNYADQFDKPYLLADTSGGEVARILGALTNVNVIFEGAREANRRRQADATTLKTRQADIAQLTERIAHYEDTTEQIEQLDRAEEFLRTAAAAHQQLDQLNTTIASLQQAAAAKKSAAQALTAPLPDLSPILATISEQRSLNDTIAALQQASAHRTAAHEATAASTEALSSLHDEWVSLLGTLSQGIHARYAAVNLIDEQEQIMATDAATEAADYITEILK
jgi:DNA repair ATPase RecN